MASARGQQSQMIKGPLLPLPGKWATAAVLALAVLLLSVPLDRVSAQEVCFEMLSDIDAIYLQEHPAGGMLVVATQDGLVRLTTLPPVLSGQRIKPIGTFLDLRERVLWDGEQGLLSFAFHPKFNENGRFFVSYICDSTTYPDCKGPCACSDANNCPNGPACPANTIVAEYAAKGPNFTSIARAEVRKILRFGRPYSNHNGGQIWFGTDGYLYYSSGDGGDQGDPLNTAQNRMVPLGKILRLDVDNIPANKSHGIPPDNPFVNDSSAMPELYALGLRNPWRCSEDPVTKTLLCGDVGGDEMEEVDIITPGGNYGWSFFEGTLATPKNSTAPPLGGTFIEPVFEYHHPPKDDGQAVIGGFVYRAQRNPCLQGKYIFANEFGRMYIGSLFNIFDSIIFEKDLQNILILFSALADWQGKYIFADEFGRMYIGTLFNKSASPSYQNASYSMTAPSTSAPQVKAGAEVAIPQDQLYSFGVDSAYELYRLASSGIYRVVNSSACGDTCTGILQPSVGNQTQGDGDADNVSNASSAVLAVRALMAALVLALASTYVAL